MGDPFSRSSFILFMSNLVTANLPTLFRPVQASGLAVFCQGIVLHLAEELWPILLQPPADGG